MTRTIVIITGANNGIGFHLTQTLLEDGYCAAALDLSTENLNALQATHPDTLLAVQCDVTDDIQVKAAADTVLSRWGQIDILVNNACLAIFKPFEQKTVEETRQEFEVNYFGYLRMINAVLPHMKARGSGLIHNVSSGVGITGFPGLCGYTSTKGPIESLTRTLALEFARYGIHINLMHPPLTRTKSASPLGIPVEVMDDPSRVGRNLAKQIQSTRPVITSDFRTALYVFLAYRYPEAIGGLFAKLTEDARKKQADEPVRAGTHTPV